VARRRRPDRATIAVLAAMGVGLILRVAWVAYAARKPVGLYDPARYLGYAQQIAKGKGYVEPFTGQPTAYYPPGYPYFLGAIAWVSRHIGLGDHVPQVAGYGQAVLGTLTVGAAAVVARRILNPAAGVVTAVLLAFYPNLIFHSAALLSESLYNALFIGALAILCWPTRQPFDGTDTAELVAERRATSGQLRQVRKKDVTAGLSMRRLLGFAVLLALAILTRPISVAFLPLLGLVWWYQTRSMRTAAVRLAVVAGVLALLVAPWTVRNAIRMDAFIPLSTNTGDNLCIGHHPHASGAFDAFDPRTAKFCDTGDGVQFGSGSEVRNNTVKTDRALTYLRGHLSGEPYLIWWRGYYMFEHDHDAVYAVQSYHAPGAGNWRMGQGAEDLFIHLADGYYAVVAILGTVGLVVLVWRRRPHGLLLVAAALATAAVPLAFFGDPRFKVPVVPLLAIAAGTLLGLAARRRDGRVPAPV